MKFGSLPAQAVLLATLWLMLCTVGVDGQESEESGDWTDCLATGALESDDMTIEFADSDEVERLSEPEALQSDSPTDLGDSQSVTGVAVAGSSARTSPLVTRRVLRVTAYCDRGLTASGIYSGMGQCAAPADVPFGSIIHIPKLNRSFVVTDRTARRFRGNTVDLFIPSYDRCLQFGRKYLECQITRPETPPEYGSRSLRELVRARA